MILLFYIVISNNLRHTKNEIFFLDKEQTPIAEKKKKKKHYLKVFYSPLLNGGSSILLWLYIFSLKPLPAKEKDIKTISLHIQEDPKREI